MTFTEEELEYITRVMSSQTADPEGIALFSKLMLRRYAMNTPPADAQQPQSAQSLVTETVNTDAGVRLIPNSGDVPAILFTEAGMSLFTASILSPARQSSTPAVFYHGNRGQVSIQDGDSVVWLNKYEADLLLSFLIFHKRRIAGVPADNTYIAGIVRNG